MNKLSIIALALVSAAASAAITIDSLPAQIGVACSAREAVVGNRKVTVLEDNENGGLVAQQSYQLTGAAADRVKSATVKTTKPGFMPQCAIELR